MWASHMSANQGYVTFVNNYFINVKSNVRADSYHRVVVEAVVLLVVLVEVVVGLKPLPNKRIYRDI